MNSKANCNLMFESFTNCMGRSLGKRANPLSINYVNKGQSILDEEIDFVKCESETFHDKMRRKIAASSEFQSCSSASNSASLHNLHKSKLPRNVAELPIASHEREIVSRLSRASNLILIASTGSGKTTLVPFFLHRNLAALFSPPPHTHQKHSHKSPKNMMIGITQPRRMAAITIANHVQRTLFDSAGQSDRVGYAVRFEHNCNSQSTRIKYMTDGMLLRESIRDPLLSAYAVLLLDEVHERSLNTDILFGVVLRAQLARSRQQQEQSIRSKKNNQSDRSFSLPPLKIVVMSATIDPQPFVEFFQRGSSSATPSNVDVMFVEGQQFELEIFSARSPLSDYVRSAAVVCCRIHRTNQIHWKSRIMPEREGPPIGKRRRLANQQQNQKQQIEERKSESLGENDAILIFMPGEAEIERCCTLLNEMSRGFRRQGLRGLEVLPLFASLPVVKQRRALQFQPHNKDNLNVSTSVASHFASNRKIIVSTNIAETSLTIPGVRIVIDSGFSKQKFCDANLGIESLRTDRISQAQAWQRAGRACRMGRGFCLQLYPDSPNTSHTSKMMQRHEWAMPEQPVPELLRCDLSAVLLHLAALRISSPLQFDWLSPPNPAQITAAQHSLLQLKLVCSDVTQSSPPQSNAIGGTHLTQLGESASLFPLPPRLATLLCIAARCGCVTTLNSCLCAVAMLQVAECVFHVAPPHMAQFESACADFRSVWGDLIGLIRLYRAFLNTASNSSRKANSASSSNLSANKQWKKNARDLWCRNHFVKKAEMFRAVKIRKQLRNLIRELREKTEDTTIASFFQSTEWASLSEEERVIAMFLKCFPNQIAQLDFAAPLSSSSSSSSSSSTTTTSVVYVNPHSIAQQTHPIQSSESAAPSRHLHLSRSPFWSTPLSYITAAAAAQARLRNAFLPKVFYLACFETDRTCLRYVTPVNDALLNKCEAFLAPQ